MNWTVPFTVYEYERIPKKWVMTKLAPSPHFGKATKNSACSTRVANSQGLDFEEPEQTR